MVDQLLSAFGDKMIINPYRYAGVGTGLLDGLLPWWSMDGSGNRVDSHTGGYDLIESASMPSVTGKVNNAVHIDSNAKHLYSTNSIFDLATSTYSFMGWVQFKNGGTSNMIYTQLDAGGGYRLYYKSSPDTFVLTVYDGSTEGTVESTDTVATNIWAHVVATHNAATKELTLIINDGTPKSNTYTETPSNATAIDFSMGADRNGVNGGQFYFDECCMYNRIVTAQNISDHYNSGSGIGYPG